MPRYLTPPRIGLLLLIDIYLSADLRGIDRDGAARILECIAKHTTLTVEHDPQLIDEKKAVLTADISAFKSYLQPIPLPNLVPAEQFTVKTVWDDFIRECWQRTESGQHNLDEIIDRAKATDPRVRSTLIAWEYTARGRPRPVTPGSPLGQFIRRCNIEFTRLQFGDIQALWKSFEVWRASSWEHWTRVDPISAQRAEADKAEKGSESNASFCRRTNFASHGRNTAAAIDTDMLLTYAIRQLQQLGTRVPEDVKTRLLQWVEELSATSAGTQSMHFFMAFFEHSKAGQYTMALESLHRYFDYSLAAKNGTADNASLRIYYQYALLHLSVLHADFECWEESVDAMNECIATARENQDTACLNYALQWLLYLRHAHPGKGTAAYASISGVVGGGEHDEIAFLKTKARETKNWLLMSSTLLEEGRLELFTGGNANRAQEHVLQAKYFCMQHDLKALAPATQLFYGSCLERLGQAHTAHRQYELAITAYTASCPLNDRVRAQCRAALTLAHQGSYTRALALLDGLAPTVRGVLKSQTRVQAFTALVHLSRSIHRGNHEASSYYLNQLLPILSAADPEIAHEFHALQIEHLMAQKDYPTAMEKVGKHLTTSGATGATTDLAQRLFWLILKARIFAEAGKATKGVSICLRATSTAERHLLVPIMLEGLAVLGRILIEVGEFEAGRDMYESALPVAIGVGSAMLIARMWVGLGESSVGLAGKIDVAQSASERTILMRRAEECIERGRIVYEKLEDIEGQMSCLTMKRRILQWRGDDGAVKQAEAMLAALVIAKRQEEVDD